MSKKTFFFIFLGILLIPFAFSYRGTLTPSFLDRYSSERDNIGFLNADNNWTGNNSFVNVTYLNENVVYNNITYNTTNIFFNSTNIKGSDLSGSDGEIDRTYISSVDMISIDNFYLHPEIDYNVSGTLITFLNPVWDDQDITLWTTEINIFNVNYVGSDATGSSGNMNRQLNELNVLQVVVDNSLLHPSIDYSYDGNTITFLNPLWDDQVITVWKQ